jgi:hypothetical protein
MGDSVVKSIIIVASSSSSPWVHSRNEKAIIFTQRCECLAFLCPSIYDDNEPSKETMRGNSRPNLPAQPGRAWSVLGGINHFQLSASVNLQGLPGAFNVGVEPDEIPAGIFLWRRDLMAADKVVEMALCDAENAGGNWCFLAHV